MVTFIVPLANGTVHVTLMIASDTSAPRYEVTRSSTLTVDAGSAWIQHTRMGAIQNVGPGVGVNTQQSELCMRLEDDRTWAAPGGSGCVLEPLRIREAGLRHGMLGKTVEGWLRP